MDGPTDRFRMADDLARAGPMGILNNVGPAGMATVLCALALTVALAVPGVREWAERLAGDGPGGGDGRTD
jgi:hypothetical protein